MRYEQLCINLDRVSQEGVLYNEFMKRVIDYYLSVVRFESARITNNPQRIQLGENVEGSYRELGRMVVELNRAFAAHEPPLQQLPIESGELSELVADLVSELYDGRRMV